MANTAIKLARGSEECFLTGVWTLFFLKKKLLDQRLWFKPREGGDYSRKNHPLRGDIRAIRNAGLRTFLKSGGGMSVWLLKGKNRWELGG
jgi:hypothetical protein